MEVLDDSRNALERAWSAALIGRLGLFCLLQGALEKSIGKSADFRIDLLAARDRRL